MYFEPTVIDKVSTEMLLNNEETFGPVVPVIDSAGVRRSDCAGEWDRIRAADGDFYAGH